MLTLVSAAMMLILVLAPLFITHTTANRNCDTDITRNTSIYTSMYASRTNAMQLTKYNHSINTVLSLLQT